MAASSMHSPIANQLLTLALDDILKMAEVGAGSVAMAERLARRLAELHMLGFREFNTRPVWDEIKAFLDANGINDDVLLDARNDYAIEINRMVRETGISAAVPENQRPLNIAISHLQGQLRVLLDIDDPTSHEAVSKRGSRVAVDLDEWQAAAIADTLQYAREHQLQAPTLAPLDEDVDLAGASEVTRPSLSDEAARQGRSEASIALDGE